MSKYWDRNGCPLNPTFTSVLLGTYGGGTLRNKNAKKNAVKLWAEQDAKAAQATKDAKAEAAAAEAAKAAKEAKPIEEAKPAEEAKAVDEAAKWNEDQDKALLNMKSHGINWKDIGIILGGKDKHVVKARYKELMATEGKDKEDAVIGRSGGSEKKVSEGKKGKDGKKDKDGKKGKEGQDKESKGKESKGKESNEKELKSILKSGGKEKGMKEPKKNEVDLVATRPVINVLVEGDDELSKDDLTYIFRINDHCDKKKWVEMASKLFDKTGKRVAPDVLERKLRSVAHL